MGFVSFSGDMEFSGAIRIAGVFRNRLDLFAGGRILADSEPIREYDEITE